MILQIINNIFHQKPHDWNYWFLKSHKLGVSFVFSYNLIKRCSSRRMRSEHTTSSLDNSTGAFWRGSDNAQGHPILEDSFYPWRHFSVQQGQAWLVIPQHLLGDFGKGFSGSCNVLQANGSTRWQPNDHTRKTRMCPHPTPCLEKREVGSFRNRTWLYIPCLFAREAILSGMRRWTGARLCQTRIPTFSPLSMVCVPFQVWCIWTGPARSRTRGSHWSWSSSPSSGSEVYHPSQQDIPWQILVDNTSLRWDGAWPSQQQSMLIHGKNWAVAISQDSCTLLFGGPAWDNEPYWLLTQMY